MKRLVVLLTVFILIAPALFAADEFELGLSVTPLGMFKSEEAKALEEFTGTESNFAQDNSIGFHFGYVLAQFLYVSADANVMPPWWVNQATSYTNDAGDFVQGVNAPGFITLLDVGIRPALGPILLMAEMGVNMLYVHKYYADQLERKTDMGFNMRLGAGYKFDSFSFSLTGTSVYSSFDLMIETLKKIGKGDKGAIQKLKESIIPSLAFSIHL